MTRVDTRSIEDVSIKTSENSANLSRFLAIVGFTVLFAITYFVVYQPGDSLGDPSDQYVVKNIPKIYTKLEAIDPEERDVFQGFRTSFLPHDELVLTKKYRERRNTFARPSDFLWGVIENENNEPGRVKRTTNLSVAEDSDEEKEYLQKQRDEPGEDYKGNNASEMDEEFDDAEASNQYDDDDSMYSLGRPETHVDRGPLDDVVEQVRGQPELEEGEMVSSAHLYKPTRSYTGKYFKEARYVITGPTCEQNISFKMLSGIHAFWKGQGDKQTIRSTQASIMKQYMDAEADPCHDFYQYACGNWPTLNPIPADKAGYDTFEMLRENLDTVLRDLLEFKPHEDIPSKYPGKNLVGNFVNLNLPILDGEKTGKITINKSDDLESITMPDFHYNDLGNNNNKVEVAIRIRRFLNAKSRKKIEETQKLLHRYFSHKIFFRNIQKQNETKISPGDHSRNHRKEMLAKRKFRIKRQKIRIGRKLQKYTKIRIKREEKISLEITELDLADGDAAMKARFLFKSCMNYNILQKRSHQPLLDLLDHFGGWPILKDNWVPDNFNWLDQMAWLRLYNNDILISEWVGPDIKNSDEYIIQFDQTSLGLPTRDYFLQDCNKLYLAAYKTYLVKIATLLGGKPGKVEESADKLIDFEIKLAKITSAPEERRNVSELYRRMTIEKLEALVPEVRWRRYLCIVMNRTVGSDETVVLFALNYVKHLVDLINNTDPSILSNYLLWRFVRHRVNNLDDRFQSAKQQFYFVLFGREQAPPRWKNCIAQVNSNMGMALGSMFVRKYFDETSKNDTLTMTREIQQSFRELLSMTDWIDQKTKTLAAHKVEAMMLRIGYPDFILNKKELDDRYMEVRVHPDKYFENILNILQHLTKMEQSRIGQPVNKTLWNTAPAVVNAYYSRNKNQIMFPAGILQPPFYHRHFPRSLNYGGIGVVIGHEITHGFDDKGRLFDCDGNLHRWWSDLAIEAFHRRAQCLINQYGKYVVPEVNMKLDGVNTQGENIADNGGVKQAFRAYLHWVQRNGVEEETLPGLNHTHTQLFFLNFAQVWCGAMRPEAMRSKLKTAVHSPGRFRVIGTLSNSQDFAREFQCPIGSPMNPVHKCTVW